MNIKIRRLCAALLLFTLPLCLLACSTEEVPRPKEGVGVATLSAVGDIYLTHEMLLDAKIPNGYDFSPLFSNIVTSITPADIAIGNFEGTFAAAPEGSYPDELAAALASTGFDILQTANSYSVFNGLSGLERTKAVIQENGMHSIGTYTSQTEQERAQVLIRDVNGIRFAFVAFTKGFQGMGLPSGAEHSVDLLYSDYTTDYEDINREEILAVLEKASDLQPDFIIASVHWGSENVSGVSESQERIADLLLNNGVDVILGSHSHRLGEIETRQVADDSGESRTCIIAYSLGDFCVTESGDSNTSVILNLEFMRDHASGKKEISNVSYTAVSTVDNEDLYDTQFAVVATDDAIRLYEGNYYLHIGDDAYKQIVKDRESIEKTLFPKQESTAEG